MVHATSVVHDRGAILRDHTYRRLRRFHTLTSFIPVGVFLVAHFTINLTALSGPEAFDRTVESISSLPGIRWIEILVIGLPIAVHVVLGAMLGNTEQAIARVNGYLNAWIRPLQRATGTYLTVYVVFHVWSTRLAAPASTGTGGLFGLMSRQLHHPLIFTLYALAVLAASAHLSLGLLGLAQPSDLATPSRSRWLAAGGTTFVLLSGAGIAAMAAFASHRSP